MSRILVLGATSAIAQAYARRRAAQGASFILAARREDRLAAIAADLKACGAASAEVLVADLAASGETRLAVVERVTVTEHYLLAEKVPAIAPDRRARRRASV